MTTPLPQIVRTRIYIDGEFVDAIDGQTFETFEPATGQVLATVAAGAAADIDAAVAAARRSFDEGSWSRIAPVERKAILLQFATLIEANAADLALFDAVEAGKPSPTPRMATCRTSSRPCAGMRRRLTRSSERCPQPGRAISGSS